MEIWKTIKNYPNYEISNLGNVKSLKFGKEKIISKCYDGSKYHIVTLRNKKQKSNSTIIIIWSFSFLNRFQEWKRMTSKVS